MAIYHISAKPISRAQGRSATGAAAYRAGVKITDERTGLVHDYTRKGGVLHSELILPGGGTVDRAEFWNGIEAHHKRGDAVLVREVEISLPTELLPEQRKALAVGYARELADRYGVAADVSLHAPRTVTDRELEKNPDQYHETDPETGRRHNGNWHAHIMLSACHVQPDGTLGKKAVELDPIHCQRAKIENMVDRERARWEQLANAALEKAGHSARIDHRSLEAQGIDREPSRHLGPAASGYERRTGQPSDKRIQQEREAVERLAKAKEQGELERQSRQSECLILDLSGDVAAAKADRDWAYGERKRRIEAVKEALEPFNPNEPMEVYGYGLNGFYARFGEDADVSQADHRIAALMMKSGFFTPEQIKQTIEDCSPEAPIREAGREADYAGEIVQAIMSDPDVIQERAHNIATLQAHTAAQRPPKPPRGPKMSM